MDYSDANAAVISGGASGLGEAVARHLAAKGVKIGILDLDEARGTVLAQELGGVFCKTDVVDPDQVTRALEACEVAHGTARIAVSCAGIAPGAKTVDRDGEPHAIEVFRRVIDINLIGTFNLATQAAAKMAPLEPVGDSGERGVIINTASIAAYEGQIGQIGYAASKGAVASMTLPMARDLARNGIRVMAMAPGLFHTPMVAGLPQQVQDALGAAVPFPPRLGNPREFAMLVGQVIENPMLNGEVIRLDGAIRVPPK